jgi:hypothetical protein
MSLDYFCDQCACVDESSFEVLKIGLLICRPVFLVGQSFLSDSLSCRAWRPAAIEILLSIARFNCSWICGLLLKSNVFVSESFAIKSLHLELRSIGLSCANQIAKLVSSSLITLVLDFYQRKP